jgi:hypothetical protein
MELFLATCGNSEPVCNGRMEYFVFTDQFGVVVYSPSTLENAGSIHAQYKHL